VSKLRVHDMAGEFGISADEVIALLRQMEVPVRSHLTLLTDDQVSRIRARWEREKRTRAEKAQPAAPAAGWLTQEERRILSAHVQALRDQRRAMERGGQTLGYSANPCGLKREADAIDALLARAGSLPVVEVPVLGFLGDMTGREQGIVLAYRDALDKAGVAWKAVPRE